MEQAEAELEDQHVLDAEDRFRTEFPVDDQYADTEIIKAEQDKADDQVVGRHRLRRKAKGQEAAHQPEPVTDENWDNFELVSLVRKIQANQDELKEENKELKEELKALKDQIATLHEGFGNYLISIENKLTLKCFDPVRAHLNPSLFSNPPSSSK